MFALLASVSIAAAAGYAGYATMSPASQLYGRTLTHGRDPRQIALTYDDGPNDPHTFHLLDILARFRAKATFFLIGRHVRQRPEIARAIHQAGHSIGNHTYSHPNLIFVSRSRLRMELEDTRKAIEDATGHCDPLFRPPFGGRRPAVLQAARDLGLTTVMWSVTGYDWSASSSAGILNRVIPSLERNRRGEIILLHDGGHLALGANRQYTVEATRQLLEKYKEKQFVAIPDLAR